MKGEKCGCVGVAPNVRTSAKLRAIQASEMSNGQPTVTAGPLGPLGFDFAQHVLALAPPSLSPAPSPPYGNASCT